MKKSLFIAALLIACVASTFAVEYTAKAKITLGSNALTLREAAEFSDAFDNGYDASQFNKTGIVVEATISGQSTTEWTEWATNDLEGAVVAFKVVAAGEQTLTFANVQGAQLYLVDAVTGEYIAIKNGGSYTFTAEAADASDWNTTRFSISKSLPYTFINNTLIINEATEGADVTVTPFTYGPTGKSLGTPATYTAPVNQVLTGNYFLVSYTTKSGTDREFIVNANPTVTPAN